MAGSAGDKEKSMKKHKRIESGFQAGNSEGLVEMMKRCRDGQTEVTDCCSEMRKIWEEMEAKTQRKNRKQK
jgi:hypothetical protein